MSPRNVMSEAIASSTRTLPRSDGRGDHDGSCARAGAHGSPQVLGLRALRRSFYVGYVRQDLLAERGWLSDLLEGRLEQSAPTGSWFSGLTGGPIPKPQLCVLTPVL